MINESRPVVKDSGVIGWKHDGVRQGDGGERKVSQKRLKGREGAATSGPYPKGQDRLNRRWISGQRLYSRNKSVPTNKNKKQNPTAMKFQEC